MVHVQHEQATENLDIGQPHVHHPLLRACVLAPVSDPVAHDVFPIPDSLMPGTAVFKSPPVPCNVQRPWNTSRFSGGITCCPLTEPGPAIPARSVVPPVVKGRKEKHERELPIGCHPVGSQPQLDRIEE
ncbi:MAG: hypothetical protein OXC57_07320 [Rhodobacteraceae bacterium]|nr:hypothetical protein [Paracoccaceae bacterium]